MDEFGFVGRLSTFSRICVAEKRELRMCYVSILGEELVPRYKNRLGLTPNNFPKCPSHSGCQCSVT